MRGQHLPMYAIVLAIVIVGALAAGVPATTLVFGLMALACPLMMLFMHGGHGHGSHDGAEAPPPAQQSTEDQTTKR
jgi:hypothetical protein